MCASSQELRRKMVEWTALAEVTAQQAIAALQPWAVEHLSHSAVPPNRPPNTRITMGDSLGSAAIAFQWAAQEAQSIALAKLTFAGNL